MTALALAGFVVLVLLNGFFVAAEFALVRARRAKLETMVLAGENDAQVVLDEMDEIAEYLSACQLGITLASIGIGFLGESALAHLFEPFFENISPGASVAISLFIAYMIATAAHITVGEQVPKIYAITHAEGVASRVARPLRLFALAFKPLVFVLNAASNGLLRLVGVSAEDIRERSAGTEEFKQLIAESLQGGTLEANEAGMLSGVFHLHEQEARQVMTPFPAVVTVDVSDDVESALRRCVDSGHTRLVVTEDDNPDRVRGFLHANQLVKRLMSDGAKASLADLVRDVPVFPETKPIDDLLAELQRQRTSLALIVDEYGRTAGIVTIEDIVEEVVGEIDDETDPTGGDVRRLANGDWFVRGHVAVSDLLDYGVELPVDTDAYNSVGGFVFNTLGRLPKRGDAIRADDYSIRVESVRENRIESVRIRDRSSPGVAGNGG